MVTPPTASPELFDKPLRSKRFSRIRDTFPQHDFLFRWCEKETLDSLSLIKRHFETVLVLGAERLSQDFLTQLQTQTQAQHIALLSHAPSIDHSHSGNHIHICGDEEYLPFRAQSIDLIIGVLGFHSLNDLPGALIQMRRALKPDGLLIGSLFGGETLFELRECLVEAELKIKNGIAPRIYPFATKQDIGALMQRTGYALPVIDSDSLSVSYNDIYALMHDLRGMGEGNALHARPKHFTSRRIFDLAAQLYKQKYPDAQDHARISAQFEIIFLHGWSPHDTQQKPKPRGSATHSLASVLGGEETKL
ncbi:MAG: methyltransferase domain-containing protein [Alphaproteobacteria bacterium]